MDETVDKKKLFPSLILCPSLVSGPFKILDFLDYWYKFLLQLQEGGLENSVIWRASTRGAVTLKLHFETVFKSTQASSVKGFTFFLHQMGNTQWVSFVACERIEPKLQFHRRSCREILSPSAWKPLFTTESQTQPWRSVITSLYGWMFKQWAKLSKFSVSFEKSKGDDGIFVLCERPPPSLPSKEGKSIIPSK